MLISFLFLKENICCGYSLEAPRREIRKIICGYPLLSVAMSLLGTISKDPKFCNVDNKDWSDLRLRRCAGWVEALLGAHVRRYVFSCCGSFVFCTTIYGSNMVFHALTFARSHGRCWKPRPKAVVFNTSQGTWRMLMHWKIMLDRYYCIKTKNICYICVISCTILFRLFTDVTRTLFLRTMLVLGQGNTRLVTAAILLPQYVHIESCVAGIKGTWIALFIHGFSPVNAQL